MVAHFHIPLNLPHAGTIAQRIQTLVSRETKDNEQLQEMQKISDKLMLLLLPYKRYGENPPPQQAQKVREEAAQLARNLVDEIECSDCGADRLGQCIRNLFECLELGEEGAIISLRAGENPDSAQRPI
ncbi:hypothetical protein [Candidatus Uabimicrobium amorphum]|uniref:Uncharacterized protein n=1 Tax=Uabimicrobium amorphum TaxID=2596890 RepID=A0A5S9F4U8_UABAM|nr:hypothetical protein [Candidatus Uabimicrobium amorphum]BBM85928.1 hypothetical protein UABAM_04314 [Candidatus Uabimicrobium amorphum]